MLLLAIGAYSCFALATSAQTADSPVTEQGSESWTAITESKSNNVNDSRTIESHSRSGNRTLDTRAVQVRGVDGHFEPYQDIEKETVQVDASTVRMTTRTFARDVNKVKTLVQVTEQEELTLSSGDSSIVTITSSPDTNGRLQILQRDTVQTKRIGEHVEESQTTVALPSISINGGLAPAVKTHEIRRRGANETFESKKVILLLDGGETGR